MADFAKPFIKASITDPLAFPCVAGGHTPVGIEDWIPVAEDEHTGMQVAPGYLPQHGDPASELVGSD